MKSLATLWLCGIILCGPGGAAAQADDKDQKVDSPIYKHWAKFKPGAFSVAKTQRASKGVKAEFTVTTTLKEITPERVVVELQIVTVGSDEKMEMLPKKQAYPAMIEKDEARKMEAMEHPKKGDKVEGAEVLDVTQGEEEIKVGEQKIKCRLLETKSKQGEQTVSTKTWTSDQVPGQVVKTVVTMEGPTEMTSETSLVKYSVDGGSKTDSAGKAEKADGEKDKGERKDGGDRTVPADKKEENKKKD